MPSNYYGMNYPSITQFSSANLSSLNAPPPMAPNTLAADFKSMAMGGLLIGIFGAATSAVGSFYQAENQKNELRAQAQNLKFSAQMSAINARGAEFSAQTSRQASQKAIGRYTMAAGQARASAQTAIAGRGIEGGVGSAAEVIGSMDIIKEIDKLTMDANAVREEQALRTQRTNYANQSTMEFMSSRNMSASARSLSATSAGASSLLGGTADLGSWYLKTMMSERLSRRA
jgi:hypothetical protein